MGAHGGRTVPDSHRAQRPERPAASDWLALRGTVDGRAREASAPLLDMLIRYFATAGADAVDVVDVGAGTGANQRWLAPRLPFRQRWTLLDHDPALLNLVPARGNDDRVLDMNRVVAGIEDLGTLPQLARRPVLLTCSAVLDVLSAHQLDGLCDVLVDRRLPALFSLTVDGTVDLSPAHRSDARIGEVFNQHQRRGTLAGPTAVAHAAARLRAAGMSVQIVDTPWRLGPEDGQLLRRYLRERAEVVIEQDPRLRDETEVWLADRLDREREGRLRGRVGHQDLLCLPPE